MTHLIKHWQQPSCVVALQATNKLGSQELFNIHPKEATPSSIQELVDRFQLPHAPHFLNQVHGNDVVEYKSKNQLLMSKQMSQSADACFTRLPNIICAVLTADCLPILLTDKKGTFVAAIHCGWRSLYANIIAVTVSAIKPKYEVIAWLGPCIQAAQYEVDEAFAHHYLKQHPNAQGAFTTVINGKCQADLYQLANTQLKDLGINHITYSNQCTYLNAEYYSWRENKTTSRMATMAWLIP